MNIKIVTHSKLVQAVNARDLHIELESGQQFSNWIKARIEEYGFLQAIDFVVINTRINDDTAFGGIRKQKDYFISIDMAKELAMVERNEKGKQARRYFIQCEKELRELHERQQRTIPHIEAMRTLLLLDSPAEWVKRFPDQFYIAIMQLHHHTFDGNKSTPSYCANITRRWIYDVIFKQCPSLLREVDQEKKDEKIHQWLTTEYGQGQLNQQIGKITMVAMMCTSRSEFDDKCGVLFDGDPKQLPVF
jgi:anti-repressor protein